MMVVTTGISCSCTKKTFNKFTKALTEAVDYVKTELMPDFDFDAYNHEYPEAEAMPTTDGAEMIDGVEMEIEAGSEVEVENIPTIIAANNSEEVDKW